MTVEPSPREPSPSTSIGHGPFLPGTILAGRYRIVSLLGRGGMGEVCRADDLKLGQPVALKFLPKQVETDASRLERFHNEVRVARQVSHPNVCRVYDIGETDGKHFISMEYIDGEDLGSLLTRIGRLPQDKAVQIGRQLCAGLAAAHERGVLHRDIKPRNIMIDGRGHVRITDFGLAGIADEFRGEEARSGTPAYMAPEQLAGKDVTLRSDIYALGLVLFEVFTGKSAADARNFAERSSTGAETPATLATAGGEDIDPAVERVILRCLQVNPQARPASALAVAAALPGGDPLAAALEAGETPSPEMVAAAGQEDALRPRVAVACLVATLIGLIVICVLSPHTRLFARAGLAEPPEVLASRASDILAELGYTDPPRDRAFGFETDSEYIEYVEANDDSPNRWDRLANREPPAIFFWYRQSNRYLVPTRRLRAWVTLDDPPAIHSGMVSVVLDPTGRLIGLSVVPLQDESTAASQPTSQPTASAPDWAANLFARAGLDMSRFEPTSSTWAPPSHADQRRAWAATGVFPDWPDAEIRIEAAAYRGQCIYFRVVGPWSRPVRDQPPEPVGTRRTLILIGGCLFLLLLGGALLLVRHNLRLGRGDTRGAVRLAGFLFACTLVAWAVHASHVPTFLELNIVFSTIIGATMYGSITWAVYIALEPFVRRIWPRTLISWSRLLAGRLHDPLVGRDLLVGVLAGVLRIVIVELHPILLAWLGRPPPVNPTTFGDSLEVFMESRHIVGAYLISISASVVGSLLFGVFLLLLFRFVLRRNWLAVAAYVLFYAGLFAMGPGGAEFGWLVMALSVVIELVVLLRFGLLAAVAFAFVRHVAEMPITSDFSAWYAGTGLAALAVIAALATYGFFTALAGRRILADDLLGA